MNARRQHSRGISLVEAVVALGVMAFGMLGIGAMQASLRQNADIARQRSEAVRIADLALEQARAYSVVNSASAGVKRAYADIVSPAASTSVAGTNATYWRTMTVTDAPNFRYKTVRVDVQWTDRTNTSQSISLVTTILRNPPEHAAGLIVPGNDTATQSPGRRNPTIPAPAIDNGNGTSTFTPPNSGGVAWVFNNASGMVEQRCAPGCTTVLGRLLSGYVSFAHGLGTAPGSNDSESPPSNALAVGLAVSQSAPGAVAAPECFLENLPPSPATTKVVAYYCLVRVTAVNGNNSKWSGQSTVTGLAVASAISDPSLGAFRVCRYTPSTFRVLPHAIVASTPASNPITNVDHPLDYLAVDRNLVNQNFLVISAGDGSSAFACPDDNTGTPLVDGSTWHHQPSN